MTKLVSNLPILVVDDNEDLIGILVGQIRSLGMTPIAATSGDDAMKILREKSVAAVLSDISMPNGSGVDLLRRAQAFGVMPPFAFITGHGTVEYLLDAVRLGAVDFLIKPFSERELKQVLERLVEISEAQHYVDDLLGDLGRSVAPQAREEIDQALRRIALLRTAGSFRRTG